MAAAGLKDFYEFELVWTPDVAGRPGGDGAPGIATGFAVDPNRPELFTAIHEQLGLRLEPLEARLK